MPEFVVEKNKKGFLWGILAGLGVGAALGVLFAPDEGENTRRKLKEKSKELKKEAEEALEELGETIEPWVEEARENIEEAVEPVQTKAKEAISKTKKRFFKNVKK